MRAQVLVTAGSRFVAVSKTAGIFIQLISSSLKGDPYVDPVPVIALVAGVIAKSVTNYRLEREN